MGQQNNETYVVWLDDVDRVASFHSIENSRQEDFICRDFFWKYIQALQESGYRFQ